MSRLVARYRATRALELVTSGMTYQQVADELGYRSRASAWKACNRTLQRREAAAVEAHREMSLVDLDLLQSRAWSSAMAGDSVAANACIGAITARCRLMGLL